MQHARHFILQLAESWLTRRLFSQILGPHRATLEMSSRASRKVASPRVVCIEDLRPLARRRVPKAVFDYLDVGAEGEVTLRENCRAFEDVTFRPRHAVSISDCDLRTRVLGFDHVLLAGRVLGRAEFRSPMGGLSVPHMKYIGMHLCGEKNCGELAGR